jgi:hypothetical protein
LRPQQQHAVSATNAKVTTAVSQSARHCGAVATSARTANALRAAVPGRTVSGLPILAGRMRKRVIAARSDMKAIVVKSLSAILTAATDRARWVCNHALRTSVSFNFLAFICRLPTLASAKTDGRERIAMRVTSRAARTALARCVEDS